MPYGGNTDDRRCIMADAKTYIYEVYTTHLDNSQMVLVQIFRDPETDKVQQDHLTVV
jgi:hypothetical protein